MPETNTNISTIIQEIIEKLQGDEEFKSFLLDPPQLSIVYPHPCQLDRPLFFVIDAVHILKCIRNNWLNHRNKDKCMLYPDFDIFYEKIEIQTASFYTLKKLYEIEQSSLVKYNHKLTFKVLSPSNIERQNVKLVLQIFNEYMVAALLELGKKHNLNFYKETARYIEIIHQWWCIVNVKSPNKGRRLRNIYMQPLTAVQDDEILIFFQNF